MWILSLLQALFGDGEKRLPASVLLERLSRELEDLVTAGEFSMDNPPQRYLSQWVDSGWLSRRLPAVGSEEEYELTLDALQALRHVAELQRPRSTATESRMSTVYERARTLAEKTDPDPQRRVAALEQQIARLQSEIDKIDRGDAEPLPEATALEAARDLIALVVDIPEDFHRVRDSFERLNADLRQSLVDHEGSRAEVLEALFAGKDLIADTDAGRTFAAFWTFLRDPGLQASMSQTLEVLLERPFSARLGPSERRYLEDFFGRLLKESNEVQRIHQGLSQSLRTFVRTNSHLENRQLNQLIRQAFQAAAAAKDRVRANQTLEFSLTLTTSTLKSISQLSLADPSDRPSQSDMLTHEDVALDWNSLTSLVASSEIDFRTLKSHIREALVGAGQISVAQLVDRYGAEQGLASVVGYLILVIRHGIAAEGDPPPTERVTWLTSEVEDRPVWRLGARIPLGFFVKGREDDLD